MGHFRTKKIGRYTLSELRKRVQKAERHVARIAKRGYLSGGEYTGETVTLESALQNWGEWREALARKQGKNKPDE